MNATADCINRGLFVADCRQLGCMGDDGRGAARRCGGRLLLEIAADGFAGQMLPLQPPHLGAVGRRCWCRNISGQRGGLRHGLFGCNSPLPETLLFEQFPALGLRGNGDFLFFSQLWRGCGAVLHIHLSAPLLHHTKFAITHSGGALRCSVYTVNCAGNALLHLTLCIFFGGFLALLGGAFSPRLDPHECFPHK